MPIHYWGDDWFKKHGKDLNFVINYCMSFWKKHGRIGSHGKEKFGTFRDHCYFWDGGIWSLFYPGYVWVKPGFWHFIYFYVDRYATRPFTLKTGLHRLGMWYQKQIYNYAIQKMCKKYPDIIDEIVVDLDYYEFVKPGIFGKIDGKIIHDKYWITYKVGEEYDE